MVERPIIFRFAAAKAVGALHWMVRTEPGVDMHTVLKACYFADLESLNKHGRPVFGARYRAMRYGPVPLEIYEIIKGEPLWMGELDLMRPPWRLDGFRLFPEENSEPDLADASPDDLEVIVAGFDRARAMNFDQRTAATHGPDWSAARLGMMRYEDMVRADNPRRAEILEELHRDGWRLAL
jgi:hypothetical protein